MNQINLMGNLGKDPQTKQVGDNTVVSFPLATSESYKNKSGEKVVNTTWHNIEAWGKVGEILAKYLHKGSKVLVTGTQLNEVYEKNGEKKSISKVRLKEFTFVDTAPNAKGENTATIEDDVDDLPF